MTSRYACRSWSQPHAVLTGHEADSLGNDSGLGVDGGGEEAVLACTAGHMYANRPAGGTEVSSWIPGSGRSKYPSRSATAKAKGLYLPAKPFMQTSRQVQRKAHEYLEVEAVCILVIRNDGRWALCLSLTWS